MNFMLDIDVPPHTLNSEWIVMIKARVFYNIEIHNNEIPNNCFKIVCFINNNERTPL